jgi:tetratricopeptide (TPR) repeat protein
VEQANYQQAIDLHKRALAIREKLFASEHPDVADSLNNLASAYQAQGNYSEALSKYQRALEIREKVLGSEHPMLPPALIILLGYTNNRLTTSKR